MSTLGSKPFGPGCMQGQLQEIALGVTSDIVDERVQCFFEGLFNGLKRGNEPGPDLLLLVKEDEEACVALAKVLTRAGYENAKVIAYHHGQETQWLRNLVLVRTREDGGLDFLLGKDPLDHPIYQMQQLKQYKEASIYPLPCPFRAGNILEGDDFFLFGKDLAQANMGFPQCIDFPAEKKQIFVGRTPASPGLSWQPIFDLDMFISLAGRIAGGPNAGKHLLLLARPVSSSGVLPPGSTEADFDAVAQQLLENHGMDFAVARIPVLYAEAKLQAEFMQWMMKSAPSAFTTPSSKSSAIWLTYNNVLAEITASEKRVWMPSYHIPSNFCAGLSRSNPPKAVANLLALTRDLDAESEEIWSRVAGFQVEKLGPMNIWADQLGAIRCLSTELRRTY